MECADSWLFWEPYDAPPANATSCRVFDQRPPDRRPPGELNRLVTDDPQSQYHFLGLAISNRSTPAATAALSESHPPRMGMRTTKSALSSSCPESPCFS